MKDTIKEGKITNDQRDKINQTIHEARGLCWHKWDEEEQCEKCGRYSFPPFSYLPDYTRDWSTWGAALEWIEGKPWLEEFIEEAITQDYDLDKAIFSILNPERGSAALAEFIDKHHEYFTKEVGE